MEQKKQICTSDELVKLSSDYPWLVAHDLDPEEDDTGDQISYNLHDPMSHYRCRIPELVGRRIEACFHGWMILSKRNPKDMEWSLWNPVTSKLICLPRMILEDDGHDSLLYCCLSSPPDDPGSILLLMTSSKPQSIVFVFCNDKRRRRLGQWMEESYSEQMKNICQFRFDRAPLLHPACCNGNIYALTYARRPPLLIQVQITVIEEEQVMLNLVPLVNLPWPRWKTTLPEDYLFLKASCTRLFCVRVSLDTEDLTWEVYLYELHMGSMVWTEINEDLKDTVFFVSLAQNNVNNDLAYSIPPIASKLGGGYIHVVEDSGDEVYSYNIKDKTISIYSTRRLGLPYRKSLSIWTIPEFRLPIKAKCKLPGDCDQMVQLVRSATPTTTNDDDDGDDEVEQMNEAPLLSVPFDVLENILKFCVGIEYLNFRATCKLCRLAAPMHKYSLTTPWLLVLDKYRGIITFKHPMFGDKNYIKASPELFYHHKILFSRHGWLLLGIADYRIAFFNPFTSDIRKLPELPEPLYGAGISFSFSAPPTSPDCMVVAFSRKRRSNVTFHRVGGEPSWYTIPLDYRKPHDKFSFPICCGEDVYALFESGGLQVFRGVQDRDNFSQEMVAKCGPERSDFAKYYQVKCDQHHLLVIVEDYGESVEVFKLNDCTQEWEEIDGLGRHMIYICDASCVCMDAKTPEMENKIYFPRLHSENGKIVFYSLETSRFHTFNGRNVEQNLTDLFGTKQTVCLHAWIEPT